MDARDIPGGQQNDTNNFASLEKLLRRPDITLNDLMPFLPEEIRSFPEVDLFTAETDLKYAGYIDRMRTAAEAMKRLETTMVEPEFDFESITAMRRESREKLARVRPQTLGQAARISGVNPPDIALLAIHLQRWRVSRETLS